MTSNIPPAAPRCHPEPQLPQPPAILTPAATNTAPPPVWHAEAYGHPTKPDIAGTFAELPDFAGYKFVFYRKLDEPK